MAIKRLSILKGLLVFCFFWLVSSPVNSQTYYFDSYSVVNGLSQSKVYCLHQDTQGYLWMGTAGGVSRFDGINFTNFSTEHGLAPGGVRVIYELANGDIWFGHNDGGVSVFSEKKFVTLNAFASLSMSDITSITKAGKDNLWITTAASGALLIKNPQQFRDTVVFTHFKGKSLSDRVFGTMVSPDSTIYFITDVGIKVFDSEKNIFNNFVIDGTPRYFQVTSMLTDSKGNIWMGTHNGGIYKLEVLTKKFTIIDTRDGLAHNFISCIAEDREGTIWVGTWGGGITRFYNDKLVTFNTSNGLPDNFIRCLHEDVEGNMLIGTNENGLAIFKGMHFVAHVEENGLGNPQVWAISSDRKGCFWFGTDGGLTRYDPNKPEGSRYKVYNLSNSFIHDKIRFIKEDKRGNLWIGTDGGGIFQYILEKDKFEFDIELNNRYFPRERIVTALEIDNDDALWVGTIDGLIYYDLKLKQGQRLTQAAGIAGNEITALFYDSKQTLWVGSSGKGITTIKDTTIKRLELAEDFTPKSFTEDSLGRIWVGTDATGVLVIDSDTISAKYRETDGILADYISFVASDEHSNIFIGSNKGLNKLNLKKNKLYTYTQKNGFVGIEAKPNAAYLDKQGNMWFGTIKGAIQYNPNLKSYPLPEPLTHITRFRVNYIDKELTQNIELSWRERSIIFDYNSICLSNSEAIRYQTFLVGADPDWRPITERTTEIYSALPSGKYTFKVRASNSEGTWNAAPISFSFRIAAPFYKRPWFIILSVVLGLIIIFSYIKVREKSLIREKQVLEEKVAQRTAEISEKNIELARKNKDITDSIRYAKRIQNALFPSEHPFQNMFILYKPKDIVSGDFYWATELNGHELLASVDCTGHGVPGAFMSIIGFNSLNKIVKEMGITRPADILHKLDLEVVKALQQKEGEVVQDGMDISLICFDREKFELQYAGAYNSLYLVRNGELMEYKASKIAIGQNITGRNKEFENHTIKLEDGDTIYLFSDGFADQQGGDKGRKFMARSFKERLTLLNNYPIDKQREMLNETLVAWQGNYEQIDDILVIGRKFTKA